jgi:hypothetical protein
MTTCPGRGAAPLGGAPQSRGRTGRRAPLRPRLSSAPRRKGGVARAAFGERRTYSASCADLIGASIALMPGTSARRRASRFSRGTEPRVPDAVQRALRAAPQSRDRTGHHAPLRPRLCSAPLRKCCALRCVRGTRTCPLLTQPGSVPILRAPTTTKGGDPVSYSKRCHLAGIAR